MQHHLSHSSSPLVIDYRRVYFKDVFELANSYEFKTVMISYFESVKQRHGILAGYLFKTYQGKEAVDQFIGCLKQLLIYDYDELNHPYLAERDLFLKTIEDIYTFFRSKLKFGFIDLNSSSLIAKRFIDIDNHFNDLVLSFYRTIEEKTQGYTNRVYRQINPGSNACILLNNIEWPTGETYKKLNHIPFIDTIMLRSPLLVHPASNKREGTFDEIFTNPINEFNESPQNWMCYPAKIGESLAYIYFHRDFITSGVSLANLFELADAREVRYKKPDLICLFGMQSSNPGCKFYYDSFHDIYVGQVSYTKQAEYFGYIKKTCLTLHNVSMLHKKRLPIHGAMVEITLMNGATKHVAFLGDSGAGKSETIEALRVVGAEKIKDMSVIFDDMGSFEVRDDGVYAVGTEIGAFVRLDDLEAGAAYREMDRSIFFNPESTNARVVIPVNTYKEITKGVKVDMFLYANNYDEELGLHFFKSVDEARPVFVEGKRKALGTTDETGISTTYFANPFGPEQKQDLAEPLIDEVFEHLFASGAQVGQIYTQLGIQSDLEKLKVSAQALLDTLCES